MTTIGSMGLGGIEALYFELAEMQDAERRVARDVRREAQAAQVDALRDQADHVEQAALLKGVGQIVEGAGRSLGGAVNATAGDSPQGQQRTGGWAQIASGCGSAGAGVLGIFASEKDADASRDAARATAEAAKAQDAAEVEEDARTARDGLLRRLETAQNLQNEARNAALRA